MTRRPPRKHVVHTKHPKYNIPQYDRGKGSYAPSPVTYSKLLSNQEKVQALQTYLEEDGYKYEHGGFLDGEKTLYGVMVAPRGGRYFVRAITLSDSGDLRVVRSKYTTKQNSDPNSIRILINGQVINGIVMGDFHPSIFFGGDAGYYQRMTTNHPLVGKLSGVYDSGGKPVKVSRIVAVDTNPPDTVGGYVKYYMDDGKTGVANANLTQLIMSKQESLRRFAQGG